MFSRHQATTEASARVLDSSLLGLAQRPLTSGLYSHRVRKPLPSTFPQVLGTVQNLPVRVTDSQMTVWRMPRRWPRHSCFGHAGSLTWAQSSKKSRQRANACLSCRCMTASLERSRSP